MSGDYECLDGEHHDFYQYVEVFSAATKRSYVSPAKFQFKNGMLDKVDGEDLGWDIFQEEIKAGVERDHRSVSVRLMNAFTLVHLADYHLVVAEDENGNPRTYSKGPKTGEFIYDRLACEGDGCPMCERGEEKIFAKKLHWSVGQGHLEQLGGIARSVGNDCASCGGQGTIDDPDKENPKCEECKNPVPRSIFDCDLNIKREGKGAQSTIQVPRWKARDLSEDLQKLAKPFDFKAVFAPDPVEVQAKILRVKIAGAARERHVQDYD